jgi:chromate transporter
MLALDGGPARSNIAAMPSPATTADSVASASPPGVAAIFLGFFSISIMGFGGVLPWARRLIVERRQWLTGDEFTELLSLCQFLPGPNIVNLSVALGARFRGIPGAIAGLFGMMGAPMCTVIVLGALYERYGHLPDLRNILAGIAAAAAGLIIATVAKIGLPLMRSNFHAGKALAVLAFVGAGLLHYPLIWVLVALAPFSIGIAWWRLR